jgi:hypothetical protein
MIDLSDPNCENGLLDMDEARAMKVLRGPLGSKGHRLILDVMKLWPG